MSPAVSAPVTLSRPLPVLTTSVPAPSVIVSSPVPVVIVEPAAAAVTVRLPLAPPAERFSKLEYVPASAAMLSAAVPKSITRFAPPA